MINLESLVSKLPILMYHHVTTGTGEGLTISTDKLEEQFAYLAKNGYRTYHFNELVEFNRLPSAKNIIITFDDGYVSQMEHAIPLLEKYNLKATFFIPLNYLGGTDEWNTSSLRIMTARQLSSLDFSRIELGFHSFFHKKYNELLEGEIDEDSNLCFDSVAEHKLKFSPALAYPFGKYPRGRLEKKRFVAQLVKLNFLYGVRIGNRLNSFPFKKPYEIQRIDIKGEFSLGKFKRKVKFGKFSW